MKILVTETFKKILDREIFLSTDELEDVEIEINDSDIYKYIRLYENYSNLSKLLPKEECLKV